MMAPRAKVVVVTRGTMGDILPILFVAGLTRKIHPTADIHILSNRNWETICRLNGFRFNTVCPPEPRHELWRRLAPGDLRKFHDDYHRDYFESVYECIEALRGEGEVLEVYGSSGAHGAFAAGERFGIRHFGLCLQPFVMPAAYDVASGAEETGLRVDPVIEAFRRTIGLDAATAEQTIFCLFPDWFAEPRSRWPDNTICTNFPVTAGIVNEAIPRGEALRRFVDAQGPPLVFLPGTGVSETGNFFSVIGEVTERLGLPAILVTANADVVGPAAGRSHFVTSFVDLNWLLPRSLAFIHHGGMGNIGNAIRAGIPQIVRPGHYDQPDNAARLSRLGLAETVAEADYSAQAVCDAYLRLAGAGAVRLSIEAAKRRVLAADELGVVETAMRSALAKAAAEPA